MIVQYKQLQSEKGLTLVELLAVIIVLAIVAAIAIPAIGGIMNNTRDKAMISDIIAFTQTARLAYADDACGDNSICTYSTTQNELDFNSQHFTEGEVDYTNGKAIDVVTIKVNIDASKFKGRHATTYADVVADSKPFTEEQLLALLQ